MTDAQKISIVTPAYNSAKTIERTIQSLLNQNYPNLEYIIIDGGSTDNTVEIIKRYEDKLHYWVSEPDSGMYDALDKGFKQASGDILGWLNSDDMHNTWTLSLINQIFNDLSDVNWITSLMPLIRNVHGEIVEATVIPGYAKSAFMRGEYSGVSSYTIQRIQQESTFWRRSLWEEAGSYMDKSLKICGDLELWARFYQHTDLIGVRTPIGGIVKHNEQMSEVYADNTLMEERQILERYNAKLHSGFSATMRRFSTGLPIRFRRLASRFGFAYQAQIAVYDFDNERWKLKPRYF